MSSTIATTVGRAKLAQARAGVKSLPKCAYIALGTGGAEADGTLKAPLETATALYAEAVRREIVQPPVFPVTTTATYTIKLEAEEYPDVIFNEMGLFDAEGDLIAIKTFNPKQKDPDMEMQFAIDDVF